MTASPIDASSDDFRDLFEEAPLPYLIEGMDSRLVRANRAARGLLGLRAEEVPATFGHTLVARTPQGDGVLQAALAADRAGRETRGLVLEMRRHDNGRAVWVERFSRPSPDRRYSRTMLVDIGPRMQRRPPETGAPDSEAAVTAERRRMAREIHDTLAQGLAGVIMQLEAATGARSGSLAAEADRHVERARALARETLAEARRAVQALRPQALEDQELGEALRAMVRQRTAGSAVRADFQMLGVSQPLPPAWEDHLLRVVQEVLANTLRHAGARVFHGQLRFDPGTLRLDLRDDGVGFDPDDSSDGFGLLGVRERVQAMHGQLALASAPGRGTHFAITLPLPPAAA